MWLHSSNVCCSVGLEPEWKRPSAGCDAADRCRHKRARLWCSRSIIDCGRLTGSSSKDPSEEHDAPRGDGGAQQSGLLEVWHPLWRLSGNTSSHNPPPTPHPSRSHTNRNSTLFTIVHSEAEIRPILKVFGIFWVSKWSNCEIMIKNPH